MARWAAAPLRYLLGYGFAQAHLGIHLGQPGDPAIGGEATPVESGFQGQGREGLKTGSGCGTIVHGGPPRYG
jgi:hypothetical protein